LSRRDGSAGPPKPVDLLIGGIGKREDNPVGRALRVLRAHLDAAHDTVRVGRGGDLQLVGLVFKALDGAAEIDRIRVDRERNRFQRERRAGPENGGSDQEGTRPKSDPARNAPPPEQSVYNA
jgi:hypothetical protein